MAKLNTTVPVRDPYGKLHILEAGKTVPKWAEELITNPDVWASDDENADGATAILDVVELTVTRDELEEAFGLAEAADLSLEDAEAIVTAVLQIFNLELPAAEKSTADEGGSDEPPVIPPRSGSGSSVEAWASYAKVAIERAGLHIEIPSDAARSDIIEALDAAKIPTDAPKGS